MNFISFTLSCMEYTCVRILVVVVVVVAAAEFFVLFCRRLWCSEICSQGNFSLIISKIVKLTEKYISYKKYVSLITTNFISDN
jgi:hypothetical protein